MIRYFIRTTNERTLDASISRELGENYTLLIDTEHNSGKAFIKQLLEINEYDAVLLEDDVILCKNFKEEIEKVINEHKDEIINFFTFPIKYFVSKKNRHFNYNQCTYYPKGISKKIYDCIRENHLQGSSQEKMMFDSLYKLDLTHYIYRPCLVQHIDKGSIMNHNVGFCRRSPYFKDYLDELNITYEQAKEERYRRKLIDLMQSKFKEMDKER